MFLQRLSAKFKVYFLMTKQIGYCNSKIGCFKLEGTCSFTLTIPFFSNIFSEFQLIYRYTQIIRNSIKR